jgi:hypothetical protein
MGGHGGIGRYCVPWLSYNKMGLFRTRGETPKKDKLWKRKSSY